MSRAVIVIGAALAAANPPAAGVYRKNAQGFAAEVRSTGIDYESTLSTCPRRTIATADGAFAAIARQYDLSDLILGAATNPSPAQVAKAAQQITAAGITTVFSEPFVPSATVEAVASAAHAKVRDLDPLSGPPAGGWPHHPDYVQLLEENLGALSAALGCPNNETGT
jgi:zinc transport system substrate-binding protein